MSNVNAEFAARMAKILELCGGNVSELARRAGISQPSAKRWLEGADPQMSNLVNLSQTTGVNIAWLAAGEGEPFPKSTDAISLNILKEEKAPYHDRQATIQQQIAKTNQFLAQFPSKRTTSPEQVLDTLGNSVDINDFVFIPYYDIELSAGFGFEGVDSEPSSHLAFSRRWLISNVCSESEIDMLIAGSIGGNSMANLLLDKDLVLINRAKKSGRDGQYAIRVGNDVFVKTVQRMPDRFLIRSQNQDYEPFEVPLNSDSEFHFDIIGEIVWLGRVL